MRFSGRSRCLLNTWPVGSGAVARRRAGPPGYHRPAPDRLCRSLVSWGWSRRAGGAQTAPPPFASRREPPAETADRRRRSPPRRARNPPAQADDARPARAASRHSRRPAPPSRRRAPYPVRAAISVRRTVSLSAPHPPGVSAAARIPAAIQLAAAGRVPATPAGYPPRRPPRIRAGVSAAAARQASGADADRLRGAAADAAPAPPVVDPQGDRVILLPTATTHPRARSIFRTTSSSCSRPATRSPTAHSCR